jgi:hypothetical protein
MWSIKMKHYLSFNLTLFIIPFILGACGADLSVPKFKSSPDSVRPGEIRGPFTGVVKDKLSQNGLKNATILVYYFFEQFGKHKLVIKKRLKTDRNGNYFIKKFTDFPTYSPGLTLAKMRLIVFHKNYYPYFSHWGKKTGFSQYENEIVLITTSSVAKSSRTLIPLLGVSEIQKDLLEEYHKAAIEVSNKTKSSLDSAALLLPETVQKTLGNNNLPSLREHGGSSEESGYILSFDNGAVFAWRVWSLLSWQVKNKENKIIKELGKSAKKINWEKKGVTIHRGNKQKMNIMVLAIPEDGMLIILGCSEKSCTYEQLNKLGKIAYMRKETVMFMEASFLD